MSTSSRRFTVLASAIAAVALLALLVVLTRGPKVSSAERTACQRFDVATATYNTDGFIGDLNSAAAVAPANMARAFGEWRHAWYTVSWIGLSNAVHSINASCVAVRGPRQIDR